jgi:hypothetical protein
MPLAEIVPAVEFPPGIPLTSQVTTGFALPLILAANCCDPPPARLADAGVIEIEGGGGGGGGGVFPPLPHPMRQIASHNASHRFSFDLFINPSPLLRIQLTRVQREGVVTFSLFRT